MNGMEVHGTAGMATRVRARNRKARSDGAMQAGRGLVWLGASRPDEATLGTAMQARRGSLRLGLT